MKEKIQSVRQLSLLIQALSVCLESDAERSSKVSELIGKLTKIFSSLVKQIDEKIDVSFYDSVENRLERRRSILRQCMSVRHLAEGLVAEESAIIFQSTVCGLVATIEEGQKTRDRSSAELSTKEKHAIRQELWILADVEEAA